MPEKTLFLDGDLREYLATMRARPSQALQAYDPDKLLLTAEDDLIAYLVGLGQVDEVSLQRDEAYALDPTEITKPTRDDIAIDRIYGRRKYQVTRWTLVVPILGDPKLLGLRASTYSLSPPRAEITSYELRIHYDTDYGPGTVDQIRSFFDRSLGEIEQSLGFTNKDIAAHNRALTSEIPGMVSARRAKHLADKRLQTDLGYPIKQRADSSAYSVPVNRRQLTPKRPTPPQPTETAFMPEPRLADKDYEAALEVLQNARNALERSPSTTNKLTEEQIRDILLVLLNGQFKGQASGEVFNGRGKTDILIRVEDRNVFIGECKFWGGPKKFTDALDQLLSYTTWRDTKAALLIFVKKGDITAITEKAAVAVRAHPNFKRDGKHDTEDRHDFVLHINGDTNRELKLALMIFAISSSHEEDDDSQ